MHPVMITFHSSAPLAALEGPFTNHARALGGVPGIVAQTGLQDGASLGGFHLFVARRAAEDYLAGGLVAGLTATPAFGEFRVAHYAVLEELSRLTRGLPLAVAKHRHPH